MTPNNLVNMALLKGLDIIAVTDHNSAENAGAVMEVGEKRQIIVVPGMEIETAEEIHVVALFGDLKKLLEIQSAVYDRMSRIRNREEIFGEQRILDASDELTGKAENLLITATSFSIEEVFDVVERAGGVCIPAHVDRSSHSVLSNLGMMPEDLPVKNIEISKNCDRSTFLKEHPGLSLPVGHFRERKLYRDRKADCLCPGCGRFAPRTAEILRRREYSRIYGRGNSVCQEIVYSDLECSQEVRLNE